MNVLLKTIPFFVFMLIAKEAKCTFGPEWYYVTEHGTSIHDGGYYFLANSTFKSRCISEWYLYKSHIVGKCGKWKCFVADEKKGQVIEFVDKTEWNNYIIDNELRPLIFTNWQTGGFCGLCILGFLSFFGFPISIPIYLFFGYAIFKAVRQKFSKNCPFTIPALFFILMFGWLILGHTFTASF